MEVGLAVSCDHGSSWAYNSNIIRRIDYNRPIQAAGVEGDLGFPFEELLVDDKFQRVVKNDGWNCADWTASQLLGLGCQGKASLLAT